MTLRLAAKAADRERRPRGCELPSRGDCGRLGYGPRAIAHAFSALSGLGTVAEALAELAQRARLERSRAVGLDFETVEQERWP